MLSVKDYISECIDKSETDGLVIFYFLTRIKCYYFKYSKHFKKQYPQAQ